MSFCCGLYGHPCPCAEMPVCQEERRISSDLASVHFKFPCQGPKTRQLIHSSASSLTLLLLPVREQLKLSHLQSPAELQSRTSPLDSRLSSSCPESWLPLVGCERASAQARCPCGRRRQQNGSPQGKAQQIGLMSWTHRFRPTNHMSPLDLGPPSACA